MAVGASRARSASGDAHRVAKCNCGAINTLSTRGCGLRGICRHRIDRRRARKSVTSRQKKWRSRRRKTGEKQADSTAHNSRVAARTPSESCTSVHNRYPQPPRGAYHFAQSDLLSYRHQSTCAIHSNDNDLWKTFLLQFESGFSRLPSLPAITSSKDAETASHCPMHLVSCACPPEPLENAPRSALLADLNEGECWDGFWSSGSDAYYVRCTRRGGEVEWFELADDVAVPAAPPELRILPLRPKTRAQTRVAVVVAKSPDGRRMLVGSARRNPR